MRGPDFMFGNSKESEMQIGRWSKRGVGITHAVVVQFIEICKRCSSQQAEKRSEAPLAEHEFAQEIRTRSVGGTVESHVEFHDEVLDIV